MNVEARLYVSSKQGTDYIVGTLLDFCGTVSAWNEDSQHYFNHINHSPDPRRIRVDAAIIFNEQYGVVFNNHGRSNQMHVCNVVRLHQVEQVSINEYNEIVKRFYSDYNRWARSNRVDVNINISKTEYELHEIITAQEPRKAFEHYLSSPCSWGHSDQERLDRFIALYVRHARKPFPNYYISQYLQSNLSWSEERAQQLVNYIDSAIETIKKYNKNRW
ncbi:hypothetical protein [Vibrio jasicida]|uniref:hypothetical protein n=1 Tax=Vibrio jasicida TaxID=766224 RepID=UPI001640E641|nr:hypothetical protein [Vibrio jasicida]